MTAKVSFWGDENVLKLIVVMDTKLTDTHNILKAIDLNTLNE